MYVNAGSAWLTITYPSGIAVDYSEHILLSPHLRTQRIRSMASFGQFNASAATFRAEATNALVNVNLEFNLFAKRFINPPAEYAGVGQHLATKRLKEAQDGTSHGVARKLGALFKDHTLLPTTPALIKSYGLRASEISQTAAANPRGNDSHGPLAGMIGADATTLWAAATSGWTAIQCHLLACLLARMWEPPEATSIWVEIITKRRHILKTKLDEEGELDYETHLAVTSDISRSDLFNWDASARAWLRVANRVMAKQQTQAKLIIDNLDIPVNSKPDTYDSVIDAWASSMKQMENLLCGIPLQVHRGDILLGLLSWHLYPDMKCLLKEERTVLQNDPLLKDRGILTLGLEPSPRVANDCKSVYWALPLAHLRYYGRLPVTRVRSLRTADWDRLTLDEMLWAMVSSHIMAWNDNSTSTQMVLEFVSNVAIELHYALGYDVDTRKSEDAWLSNSVLPSNTSWLTMIARVCLQYKDRLREERVRKLQALGRRFHPGSGNPFNGIFNLETYLRAGRSIEDKIKLLREMLSSGTASERRKYLNRYEFIITYRYSYPNTIKEKESRKPLEAFEYATALPEFGDDNTRSHRRWIVPKYGAKLSQQDVKDLESRQREIQTMKENIDSFDPHRPAFTRRGKRSRHYYQRRQQHLQNFTHTVIKETTRRTQSFIYEEEDVKTVWMEVDAGSSAAVEYIVVSGSLDNVALIRVRNLAPVIHQSGTPNEQIKDKWPTNQLTIRQIMNLFQPAFVDFTECAVGKHVPDTSLLAMTLVEDIYRDMGDATIDVRAVQMDFTQAKWVSSAIMQAKGTSSAGHTVSLEDDDRPPPYLHTGNIDTATCFACIAMMETGSYNLYPNELRSVIGLCASDSLYIVSCLLQDPADRLSRPPILRFTGNIGRAGMAFMVPPLDPEIRRYDLIDEWYQYDHKPFTGVMEDCFQGTSLHISFSEASQAVNVNFSGGPDVEAYFLETLISVYSRAEWIAELDILGSVTNPNLTCDAHQSEACSRKGHSTPEATTVISIDNFAELLVPPQQPGIIRAEGNWQARLAATALCLTKGYKVVIKAPNACLSCLLDKVMAGNLFLGTWTNKDVLMII
jgi:hypothetical protein